MKTVSLVLGSGGARGLAHIGVIHWLEENGYEIRSISGSSVGAMIGGIYAAGKLDEFEKWVRAITKLDILALLDISWSRSGLVEGDKIVETLVDLVGDLMIEDLAIPFTAVATNLDSEKEVWINSGNLFDAIRASISLPLFFTPFEHKGIKLIDGGVLNPVPIAPTFKDDTQMTIAVNLGGPLEHISVSETTKQTPLKELETFQEKIGSFIENFQKKIGIETDKFDLGIFDIANQSFDAMQSTIARQKLAAYPPDHEITIARNACGTLEFDRAEEMITLGYQKAKECFSNL
jgi:NTE family protein